MTLTKAELAGTLLQQVGLNKRESNDMVEAFFEEISLTLEGGEAAKLSGFGHFEVLEKSPRPGRNPKTGEEVPITARRVVSFYPSRKLKDSVEPEPNAKLAEDSIDAKKSGGKSEQA